MRWIVGTSLKLRFLVVAVAVAMLVFGSGQLRATPVDVFPEFAPPRVQIQTTCIGLSSADVESLVTVPLEQALNGIPGLDVMRSKSVADLSYIELLFKPGTDLLTERQLVQERLAAVTPSLPTWAAPPVMLNPLSSTSRIMKIGLSSNQYSLIDMSMIAYWTIRARLLRVPGVANVAIWGERIRMPVVQADPERMRRYGVTLDQVMQTTADALDVGLLQFSEGGYIGTGGFIDTPNQRLGVQHVLPIITPQDLAQIVVAQRDGQVVRLSDVANVVEDHQPLIGDAVINDGPGLMLVVEKLPWANTLEVTREVERALDELRPGLPGIQM
ncbi:MAG: efflux RND transporter permease subunit, partial [Thermomicrobiaceae bacterium]|nr:efflux RND transporter permease subunit [Thermomicrobiaceae bacterium]